MGSVWLTTYESDVEEAVINKLLKADSGQTMRSRAQTGKPVRMLRTPFEAAWDEPDAPEPLRPPLQGLLVKPAISGIYENHMESLMGSAVGQGVGMLTSRRRADEVITDLMSTLLETIEHMVADLDLDG
jgi:NAD(P)H-dependent flavin oxidoreductase YrpB (nitropropane dioxygenase family)